MEKIIKINQNGQLRRAARKLLVDEPEKLLDYPPKGWDKTEWQKLCRQPYEQRLKAVARLVGAEMERIANNPDYDI